MPIVNTIKIPLNTHRFLYVLAICGMSLLLTGISLRITGTPGFPVALLYVKNALALAGILLFGAGAAMLVSVMLRKSGGLLLSEDGITDNSSFITAGVIPWRDITAVEPGMVLRQHYLAIRLRDPQAYITRQTNPLKRLVMRQNLKRYGSPALIASNNVLSAPDDLLQLIASRIDKNGPI